MSRLDPNLERKALAGTLNEEDKRRISKFTDEMLAIAAKGLVPLRRRDTELFMAPWAGQATHTLSETQRRARKVRNKAKRRERAEKPRRGVAMGAAMAQTRRRSARRSGFGDKRASEHQ